MKYFENLFKNYEAIVFFDVETTGLDAKDCQITELAAIRVEQTESGELQETAAYDNFVNLMPGHKLSENVILLTGITEQMLEEQGIPEERAAEDFENLLISKIGKPVIVVAHNAQFDLSFAWEMMKRHTKEGVLEKVDYLDTLTVYKDRRSYPHKLANAIIDYGLSEKVQNSHRAIGDTRALFEVCKALDEERSDLAAYINVFGYNPRYGVSGVCLEKIAYCRQPYRHGNEMVPPEEILPFL